VPRLPSSTPRTKLMYGTAGWMPASLRYDDDRIWITYEFSSARSPARRIDTLSSDFRRGCSFELEGVTTNRTRRARRRHLPRDRATRNRVPEWGHNTGGRFRAGSVAARCGNPRLRLVVRAARYFVQQRSNCVGRNGARYGRRPVFQGALASSTGELIGGNGFPENEPQHG
jgi:hypothetical protein